MDGFLLPEHVRLLRICSFRIDLELYHFMAG